MIHGLLTRLGCFLYLIGFVIFIIYLSSDFAQTPNYTLLLVALGIFALGFLLRRRGTPPPSSDRFRTIRKLMSLGRKDEQDEEE